MKKKLIVLSLMAALAATVTTGTVAYYTSIGHAHNVITSGDVEIELIEKMKKEDGTEVDFPEEGIKGVLPGVSVSKIVSVANTGEGDAWVRVSLEQTIKNEAGEPMPLEFAVGSSGSGEPEMVPVMEIELNRNTWMEGGDGYFYYYVPLHAGESTEPLFEEVRFAEKLGDAYQGTKANIIVNVEAVQSDNNPIPEGGDVMDVKGWPESETGGV